MQNIENFNLSELPSVELLEKEKLPTTAGIYFVVDSNNQIWYIGQAQNLKNRWINHHRYDQLEKINKKNSIKLKWYKCENNKDILNRLENYFIDTYYPILNQTKVELKQVTPTEINLRETLVKISKYVIICGYEKNSNIFGLPTVFLKYDWLNHNPVSILRKIFDADNRRCSLKWSYYRRVKTTPIWTTKCNGICIVIGCDTNINYFIQNGEATTLAGISLLNISTEDFKQYVIQKDWSGSYHPDIQRYVDDTIPLLWSKNLQINQLDAETIKESNQKRTESKIGKGRTRDRQVKVYCEAIGKGKFVIKAYQEAIEWFGGYEILGLTEANYLSWKTLSAPKWFKPHKVTVKIPEENSYRTISAPISASTHTELEERLERVKQLSPLHQKVKFQR